MFKKKKSIVHFKEYYGPTLCGEDKAEMCISPFNDDMIETIKKYSEKYANSVPCVQCVERHPLWQLNNANLEKPDNEPQATMMPPPGRSVLK